ncbi:MAG: hypothetical protein HQK59_17415, partial [Deltaproteobacteria bacterium]|nr:hypothetical protein [Deltaproteobacteria bacterium]
MAYLIDAADGRQIELRRKISSGGQGSIWTTDRPGCVAKVYHSFDRDCHKKLEIMLKNRPDDPTAGQNHISIAWPVTLLNDHRKRFEGFLMPGVPKGLSLVSVYNPKLRKVKAPGFDWYYLHTAALNVAIIMKSVHEMGYVIGDIKQDNLLINDQALMTIIDTDSFQVTDPQSRRTFVCPVGSDGYTPPELLGKDFAKVTRTEVHDRFGLGVLIHLLLFGYHPFFGQWKGRGEPPDQNELIAKGHWPYAPASKLVPGPLSIPIDTVHQDLQKCFRRCFADGHAHPKARPTADEWRLALRAAILDLNDCAHSAGHWYLKGAKKCYWCERYSQLKTDIFPAGPNAGSNIIVLTQQLHQCLTGGEERKAVLLWQRHKLLQKSRQLSGQAQQLDNLAKTLADLDQITAVYRRNADDEEKVVLLWDGNPNLAQCRTAHSEQLGGMSIFQLMSLLKNRLAAYRILDQALAYQTRGMLNEAGEKEIVSTYDRHSQIVAGSRKARTSYLPRVEEARRRLTAWKQFQTVVGAASSDERQLVAAWGANGLLDNFEPARAFLPQVDEARRKVACLEQFISLAIDDIFNRNQKFIQIKQALDTNNNAAICSAWDEQACGRLTRMGPFHDRIRQAFRRHVLEAVVLEPLPLAIGKRTGNNLSIRGKWPGGLGLCFLAVSG